MDLSIVDRDAADPAVAAAGTHRGSAGAADLGDIRSPETGSSDRPTTAPPFSLTLGGTGTIATAWGDKLVVAVPYGPANPQWETGGPVPLELRSRSRHAVSVT